jgi:hypothetical protein
LPSRRSSRASFAAAVPHDRGQLFVNDLHDVLVWRQALRHVRVRRALAHTGDELLRDLEVDVGLEEGETDLAHGLREILVGEAPTAAQIAERGLQLVGKRVKHGAAGKCS